MRRLEVSYDMPEINYRHLLNANEIKYQAYIYEGRVWRIITLFTADSKNTEITLSEVLNLDLPIPGDRYWNLVEEMKAEVEK